MTQSYTKFEKEFSPRLKENLALAESDTDAQSLFYQVVRDLILKITDENYALQFEDLSLLPGKEPYFTLSEAVLKDEGFASVWNDSDLKAIISRFARATVNRCAHLEKHPEKTESKIFAS